MIICPGGDSPSDLLTPWASEIARRGFVVALVDYTGCGDTEVDNASQYWTNHGAMGWKQSTTIWQIGHS